MKRVVTLSEPLVRRFLWSLDKRKPLDVVNGIDGMTLVKAVVIPPCGEEDVYPMLDLIWEGPDERGVGEKV